MSLRRASIRRVGAAWAVAVVVVVTGMVASTSGASASAPAVRGFDGKTVTVASLGIKQQLPGVETGAQARIKRFNDENELKGVKIDYTEFADDKQDPATALSETRRLVTQEGIFALVGDVSPNNPGDYLKQQHVPYFGMGFDNTYCSTKPGKPDTSVWGFGFNGCLVPADPTRVPDTFASVYQYVKEKTGNEHPTWAIVNTDTESGKTSTANAAVQAKGAGFDVVFAKAEIPATNVSDYTPYVQNLLTADDGKPPDVITCYLAVQCVPLYGSIKANNYQGTFYHTLYAEPLMKPFVGSVIGISFGNFSDSNPSTDQMKADVEAFKPNTSIDLGVAAGYFSASQFIEALKLAAKGGKSGITPENVQKAASTMTFTLKGLVGPTKYPASTVLPTPACSTLVLDDGTAFKTIGNYSCSVKSFPVK